MWRMMCPRLGSTGCSLRGLLNLSAATRVLIALAPVDLRGSFNRSIARAQNQLAQDPLSGHLFVFTNRLRNRLKILFWDGSGLWVCAKRLEKGRFRWPEAASGQAKIALSHEELTMLLGGIDLASTRRRPWYRKVTPGEQKSA